MEEFGSLGLIIQCFAIREKAVPTFDVAAVQPRLS
jgi:hypothetical protein